MNWERFESLEQAKTLVQAFQGEFMAGVFKRILKDPRNTSSGMPDLVVWNKTEKTFRVSCLILKELSVRFHLNHKFPIVEELTLISLEGRWAINLNILHDYITAGRGEGSG
jgi:hypothetical protein